MLYFLLFNQFLIIITFYIKHPFRKLYNLYEIKFGMGNFENITSEISLYLNRSIINTYLSLYSITFRESNESKNMTIKNIQTKLYKCYDLLTLINNENNNFFSVNISFYQQIYRQLSINYNILSFSKNFEDFNTSLVYLLKYNDIIDSLKFSFINEFIEKYNIYFGNLPNNIINENKFSKKCKVNKKFFGWSCNLTSIIIDNKIIKNNYFSIFETNHSEIFVPKEIFNQIVKYLNNLFSKKYCDIMDNKIICKNYLINKFPNIIFVFDEKIGFIFNYEFLFNSIFGSSILIISVNPYRNEWNFGINFLEKFNITFDYEKNEIKFYSNNKKNLININSYYNKIYIKIILKFLLIINIMGIFLLIFNNKKMKNNILNLQYQKF